MGCMRQGTDLRQRLRDAHHSVRFEVAGGAIVRHVRQKMGDVVAFESWTVTPMSN